MTQKWDLESSVGPAHILAPTWARRVGHGQGAQEDAEELCDPGHFCVATGGRRAGCRGSLGSHSSRSPREQRLTSSSLYTTV